MNIFKRIIFFVCILASANAMSQANAIKTGDWNDHTVWSTNVVPTAGTTVTIAGGFTVTLDGNAPELCSTLTIGTAVVAGTLVTGENTPGIYNGAGSLTTTGAVTVNAMGTFEANPSFTGTSLLFLGGNLTGTGTISLSPSSTDICDITINGASTITGTNTFNNLTLSPGAGKIVTCTAANQTVAGTLTVSSGTLALLTRTMSAKEIVNNAAITISTGGLSVSDSLINNSSGTVTFSNKGNLLITGDADNIGTVTFSATAGSVFNANNIYNSGAIVGVTASISPTGVSPSGNITNFGAGTITFTTGKLNPTGKIINSSTASPSISITTTGTINSGGDFDISAGTIVTGTGLITVGSAIGGGDLNLSGAGSIAPSGASSITIPTGNLSMTGTSSITLKAAANLTITTGTATINSNTTPALTVTMVTGTLSVHSTTSIGSMSIVQFSTGTLTATGDLTNNGEIHYTGAGKLNIGGNYTFNGTFVSDLGTTTTTVNGTANQTLGGTNPIIFDILVLNNATLIPNNFITLGTPLTTNGNFTITHGVLDVSPYDYPVTIKGNFANNYSKGAFVARKGLVTFSTNVLTIGGTQNTTFNDVVFSGGVTATLALANDTVLDTLSITATGGVGTFKNSTFQLYVGNAFLDNGGTFTTGTGVLNFGGNATTGNYIGGSTAITIENMTVNLRHQTDTLYVTQSNLTVGTVVPAGGALIVTTGVLHSMANNIGTTANTTINLAANTTFILGLQNNTSAVPFPVFKTYTLNAASTVIYQANAASQTVSTAPTPYGNLFIFSGAAPSSVGLSSAGAFNVDGNFEIGDGVSAGLVTLTATTNAITIQGNFTMNNNGAFVPGTGTITMAATLAQNRAQTIGGTAASATFSTLIIDNLGSKAVTLSYPITVNTALTITIGTLDVGGTNEITCKGTFTNSSATVPSFSAGTGIFNFANGANANLAGTAQTTFYNLYVNTTPTFSVTVTGSHVAPMEVVSHELQVNSGTFALGTTTVNFGDTVINATGATITASTGKLVGTSVTGDIDNNGIISFTGAGGLTAANFYNNSGATFTVGTAAATINKSLYNNSMTAITLTTGNITLAGAAPADSVFNNTGASITVAGTGKILATGDIDNTGTISFSAAGIGTLTAANFYNNSGATFTLNTTVATISKNLYNNSAIAISLSTGTINQSTVTDSVFNTTGASITFSGAGKLQATGNIDNRGTISFGGAGTLKAVNFTNYSAATLTGLTTIATISGNLYNYSTVASPASIGFSTGTINVTDSVYNTTGASITYSGAGTLNASGNIGNYGTITFPAAAAGTLKAANFNIYTGGLVTGFTYAVTVSGNLIINGTLTYTGAGTLKIAGNYVDNGIYTTSTNTTTFNGLGTAQTMNGTVGPLQFYNLTIAGAVADVVTLGDSVQVNRLLTITTGVLDVSASAYHLICKVGFTNSVGTTGFVAHNGTVYFNGTQTITGVTNFNTLQVYNGTVTLASNETVQDTLNLLSVLSNGAINNGANTLTIGNAFFNNSGAAIITGAGIVQFTGNITPSNYIGGAKGITLKNMIVNLTNPTDTLSFYNEGITVNTTGLNITQGVLNCQQFTLVGGATPAQFTMSNTATLILGSKTNAAVVPFPTNFVNAHIALANSSTVIYQSNAAAQVVSVVPSNYGNLYLYTGGTSSSKTIAANLTVNGNLIIGNAIGTGTATLSAAAHTINLTGNATINADGTLQFVGLGALIIAGNFTNNLVGTGLVAGTSTVTFNSSTGNQVINGTNPVTGKGVATNFNNVIINNTFGGGKVTLGDSTVIGGIFTINSGGGTFDVSASNYSLMVNGGFNNNNTPTSFNAERGTVYFNGSQTIGNGASSVATTFYDVTSKSGTVTMNAVNDSLIANFIAAGGTFAIGANTLAVDSNVTLNAAGGSITLGAGALNVGGNFTNNNSAAAFTGGTSTTTFNGAGTTQTIGGSFTTTFNNVAINGYNVIIAHNENAAGTFKINSGGTFDCGSLTTMAVTGTFTNVSGGTFLGDNGTLALSADLTNNSTFTAQTGTVSFNNNGAESINGTKAVSFYNATLNNAAIVNVNTNTESLQNILTLNNTSQLAGTGSDSLIMLSTPALTARIAPVAVGASITLPFNMQRYVSGTKAAYEALAAPSQASTLADWAYDAGFYMSGVGGPDGNAGSFKSVYTIDEPTDAYVAVTTTSQPLTPGLGLYIYMANSLSTFAPFTFATHDLPTYGTFTYGVTHSNTGSNLVGNPYDCPLSWTALRAQGGNTALLGTDFSVFDRTTGNWESSDGTTVSCAGCALASQPNVIPEHQGFLVLANSSGSMTFAEAAKTTTLDQPVYGPVAAMTPNFLRITLTENANTYSGNALIGFDNAAQAIYDGKEDVLYKKGLTDGAPVLYTLSSDTKFLSRNLLPMTAGDDQDIMFYAGGNISGNYTLTFTGIDGLTKYNCVQLEDLKTGKLVQVEEGTTYTYQMTTGANYKFILHFKKLQPGAACVLPVMANVTNENTNEAVDVFRNEIGAEARFTLTETQQAIITVYNALGQQIGQEIVRDVMDEAVQIPLPSTNAMYIIRIQTPSGVTTKRIYR